MTITNTLNRDEFKPRNKRQNQILIEYIKISKFITKLLASLVAITGCFFVLHPFTVEDGPFLPLPAYLPFKADKSPYFEMIFIGEIIGIVTSALCYLAVDVLFLGLLTAMCAQLEILNDSLLNLGADTEIQNKAAIDYKRESEMMSIDLVRCIKQHRYILQFVNKIQSRFSVVTFGQFMLSVLVLCTTLYELSLLSQLDFYLGYMIIYLLLLLSDIFLPCYLGSAVFLKHQKLTNSAYHCEWINTDEKFKKNLLYFLTISQKDLKISAGGYVTLSIDTFITSVIKLERNKKYHIAG
ncbi:odorant receptor Or1-like [Diorhabda carinulata]|uniref:odorant receptor Or1-like n=1 Tax=Diorhabda carinulata TaxID=1163345 RepID=UPI0025A1F65D|nr:odorant receptor Or1-like [Diorhabda carinulata]